MALLLSSASSGHATETRVVSGAPGGSAAMVMTYVGCDDFFAPSTAPVLRVNIGPLTPPVGRRSLGFVPAAAGTASGPYMGFASLAHLSNSASVTARTDVRGVSYVWFTNPGTLPGTAWLGRAELQLAGGRWHEVAPARTQYSWTLVHLATRRVVAEGGGGKPAEFAAIHGDGPGYVVTGFGCDGGSFNIDAVRNSDTTWDFEGLNLTTHIAVSPVGERADTAAVPRVGGRVAVAGTVKEPSGRITGDPLQLEIRAAGGTWEPLGQPVLAEPDGVVRVEVTVEKPGEFRWHRPESQYADEGWSNVVTIGVDGPIP